MKSTIGLFSLILTAFLFSFNSLFSESVFQINNLDISNNLNSKLAGDWQVSSEKIDAKEYFANWEKGFELVSDWKNYTIPGNLSTVYSVPFPKNFKVFLKKEIILPNNWSSSHFSIRLVKSAIVISPI